MSKLARRVRAANRQSSLDFCIHLKSKIKSLNTTFGTIETLTEIQQSNGKQHQTTPFVCIAKTSEISHDLLEWAFHLTKKNVKNLYGKEWSDESKKEELFSNWMRYLLLFIYDRVTPSGFAAFRLDEDFNRPVLYLYELQINPEFQGKGFGSKLLYFIEELCIYAQMERVVLTSLKKNVGAKKFYQTRGYEIDPTCPSKDSNLDVAYEIFSKNLK